MVDDFIIYAAICAFTSFIFSLIFGSLMAYLMNYKLEREVKQLGQDLDHAVDSFNGKLGQQVKQEKAEVQEQMMQAAQEIMSNNELNDDQKKKALLAVAAQNPGAAIGLLKQFGKAFKGFM